MLAQLRASNGASAAVVVYVGLRARLETVDPLKAIGVSIGEIVDDIVNPHLLGGHAAGRAI